MRCMVMLQAAEGPDGPAGERVLAAMEHFDGELVRAGVLLAGERLHPAARGVRIAFSGDARPQATGGPSRAATDAVAGFWLWQVHSMAEAVEWARRIPNPEGGAFEVEIRPILEARELGQAPAPRGGGQPARLRIVQR